MDPKKLVILELYYRGHPFDKTGMKIRVGIPVIGHRDGVIGGICLRTSQIHISWEDGSSSWYAAQFIENNKCEILGAIPNVEELRSSLLAGIEKAIELLSDESKV